MPNYKIKPRFVKGVCPNPKGRPKSASKALRQFTAQEVALTINELIQLSVPELRRIAQNPETPAIRALVARTITSGYLRGEWDNFDKVLSRFIGKVPDKIEHAGVGGKDLIPPTFNILPIPPAIKE